MRNSVDFFLAGLTDVDGNPCYGYLIYTYEAGTTTPKETYTDAELTTPATNPIVLDVSGRASIFANGSFKFVLKTPEGETVYTWDNLYFGENSAFRNRGDWETDTVYNPRDYVFDRSTDDGDVKSMWFVLGTEAFTSSTQPYLDTDNWSEFPAVAGPQGIQGEKGDTGDVSGDFTDYSEKTSIVDNDLFLINDSEAAGAVKRVKKSNLGISASGGGGNGGGITQTVLSSKLTSGLPVFITDPNDGLKVNIDTDNGDSPVIISFANGFDSTGQLSEIGVIDEDTSITGLTANATNYLFAERNSGTGAITLGKVTVAPVYQNTAPSHAANLYWFSIPEMVMYLSNGSNTWTAKEVVFLGEAVTSGGEVTSVVNYALRGVYTPAQAALAAASTFTAFSHNIGIRPRIIDYRLVCTDTDLGYGVGDCLMNVIVKDTGGNSTGFVLGAFGRNAVYYEYPAYINGTNASTHAINGSITPAKWAIQVYCARGW